MKIETPSQRKLALLFLVLCAVFLIPIFGLAAIQ
jgi:hypothetical protein